MPNPLLPSQEPAPPPGPPVLTIQRLSLRFGGLTALNDVSLTVLAGTIHAVIGPNGAGKTSLFNVVTGLYRPTSGSVSLANSVLEEPWTKPLVKRWAIIGLICAIVAVLVANGSTLWQAAVVDPYLPGRPFSWAQSWRGLTRNLAPSWWTILPFLFGAIAGPLVSWRLWSLARCGPERIARAGIARTFQNIRLFKELSALDNVRVALDQHYPERWWQALIRLPTWRAGQRAARAEAQELLAFVGLESEAQRPAGDLPYGHQRRLEIARALALRPRVLLLDEPAAGMNPSESAALMHLIRRIRGREITVLLIEHDMSVVMAVSDRVSVLHYGAFICHGPPQVVRRDPRVIEAYLGRSGEPTPEVTAPITKTPLANPVLQPITERRRTTEGTARMGAGMPSRRHSEIIAPTRRTSGDPS